MYQTTADQSISSSLANGFHSVGRTPTSNHFTHQLTFLPNSSSKKNYIFKYHDCNFLLSSTFTQTNQGLHKRGDILRNSSGSLEVCLISVNSSFVTSGYTKHFSPDLKPTASSSLSLLLIFSPTHPHPLFRSVTVTPSTHCLHTVASITEISLRVTLIFPWLCSISYLKALWGKTEYGIL